MITFQYFEGCPNSTTTLHNLRAAVRKLKVAESLIEIVEVVDIASASALHFQGSPSVLLDGVDLVTGLKPDTFSYSCRIYPFDPVHSGVIPEEVIVQLLQSRWGGA